MPTRWRSPRKVSCASKGAAKRFRGAFTLAEILLVLAVLVIIAAFAVPVVKGSLDNYQLRQSADTIRSAFATARSTAARTGVTYVFQYTPDTAEYSIQPWASGDESLEMSTAPTINMGGASSASSAPSVQPIKTRELPSSVKFHSSSGASSVRDLRAISNSGSTTSAMASAPQGAAPILFYSDGSSSSATLVLKNDRGSFIEIKLRGLTGHASASKLLSSNQLSGS